MVDLYSKIEFVKFIVRHDLIANEELYNFLKNILRSPENLEKISFSMGKTKLNYKYKFYVNLRKDVFIFEKDGKKYNDSSILRSMNRLLSLIDSNNFCICVLDKQNMIKNKLNAVCESKSLIDRAIFDANINLMLIDQRKKILLEKIDQSLIEKDKEKFDLLCIQYKNLLK
ncbi:hypothetical protein D3C81_496820 [compost metagenome]